MEEGFKCRNLARWPAALGPPAPRTGSEESGECCSNAPSMRPRAGVTAAGATSAEASFQVIASGLDREGGVKESPEGVKKS